MPSRVMEERMKETELIVIVNGAEEDRGRFEIDTELKKQTKEKL